MKNTIYVDESGDLGLSYPHVQRKPYFVFGYVYTSDSSKLEKSLRRLLKRLHDRNRYPSCLKELKFNLPRDRLISQGHTPDQLDREYEANMQYVRTRVLNVLVDHVDGVFAAIVNKRSVINQEWTPERLGNYVFAQTLLVNVMNKLRLTDLRNIVYDKGRLSQSRSAEFRLYLMRKDSYFNYKGWNKYSGSLPYPKEISSDSDPGIWAADYVAGAFNRKYSHGDSTYADILNPVKIGSGERIFWE